MMEAARMWFLPDGLTRKEKIKIIQERDKEISEAIALQVSELETAIEGAKCNKLLHSGRSGRD